MEAVWLAVLGAALLGFGGMIVVCGIGGIYDILDLFRFLQAEHKEQPPDASPE